jgi:glycosyltransferase AglD
LHLSFKNIVLFQEESMAELNKLTCFIPVFNEAKIIKSTAEKIKCFLDIHYPNTEIVIVDDASSDITEELVEFFKRDRIKYIRCPKGPSKRENLAALFKETNTEYAFFIDADLSPDISVVPRLLALLENGYDIAIASRYIKGAKIKRSFLRLFLSCCYNIILRMLFGSKIRDHQCGLKAFKRGAIISLVEEMGYDHNYSRGWFWDGEMLIRAQRKKYRIAEVPVKWLLRACREKVELRSNLCVIFYIIKFWRLLRVR